MAVSPWPDCQSVTVPAAKAVTTVATVLYSLSKSRFAPCNTTVTPVKLLGYTVLDASRSTVTLIDLPLAVAPTGAATGNDAAPLVEIVATIAAVRLSGISEPLRILAQRLPWILA